MRSSGTASSSDDSSPCQNSFQHRASRTCGLLSFSSYNGRMCKGRNVLIIKISSYSSCTASIYLDDLMLHYCSHRRTCVGYVDTASHHACAVQICVSGWSMGAIHACMIASLTRFPVATAALLPPRCASTAYCDGALSEFVDLRALRAARDAHGVPVLETAASMFVPMPNYPNPPQLFQHLSGVADPSVSTKRRMGVGTERSTLTGQGGLEPGQAWGVCCPGWWYRTSPMRCDLLSPCQCFLLSVLVSMATYGWLCPVL